MDIPTKQYPNQRLKRGSEMIVKGQRIRQLACEIVSLSNVRSQVCEVSLWDCLDVS